MESDVIALNMDKGGVVEHKIATGNLGVRTFALSADSKHIAIADVDGSVCVHSLDASTSVDGTHHMAKRDLETFNSSIITKDATRSPKDTGCKISWYPLPFDQLLLAVPSTKGSVVVLSPAAVTMDGEERKWEESFLIAPTDGPLSHGSNDLNMVEFSPNGLFLATADMQGTVLVWAFDAKKPTNSLPLRKFSSNDTALTDLVWGRTATDNYLIATCANDWFQFGDVVTGKVLPAAMPASHKPAMSFTQAATQEATQATQPSASEFLAQTENDADAALLAAVEAAEAQYALSQKQPAQATNAAKSPTKVTEIAPALKRLTKSKPAAAMDDDDDLFNDDASVPATTTISIPTAPMTADEETTSIAAIKHKAGVSATSAKRLIDDEARDLGDEDSDDDDEDIEDNMIVDDGAADAPMSLTEMMKLVKGGAAVATSASRKLQPAFQPSSTKFDEKRRRYLVWNNVGSIVLREESIENRVEIRFSNTAGGNRNESFADRTGFVMGALSYEGAIFASEPEPAEEPVGAYDPELRKETPGSTIYYHAFPGQKHMAGVNESFRWTLSDGEAAQAVAVGRGWVAVASSRNLLYIYSCAGMPCATFALAGPVLALSGNDALLGVVYHNSTLQADLFEINWQTGCRCKSLVSRLALPLPAQPKPVPSKAPVPVPAEQSLTWMGFDVDNHLLMVVDGQGMLWSLVQCAGWQWVPVLDIHHVRKSTEHIYWPVQVKFNKLVYVLLNGESRPAIYPQPVVSTRPLSVPVPSMKDGKDVGDVHKERMHSILWDNALTMHGESLLAVTSAATAAGQVTVEDPEELEKRVTLLQFEADKAVLKALQDACQRQRIPLALSLALQLRTEKVIEAAITIANHFGRAVVAEALDNILEHKRALAAQLEEQQLQNQGHSVAYSSSEYAPADEDMYHEAPTFDAPTSPPRASGAEKRVNFNFHGDTAAGGNLSNKLTKALPGAAFKAQAVSPENMLQDSAEKAEKPAPAPARNPFAVVSTGHTPQKRKNVFDGIQDMKASPSPKKPTLNVRFFASLHINFVQICLANIHRCSAILMLVPQDLTLC